MVAGKLMRNAIREAANMIRNTPCEHKIGMCRCPLERWQLYQLPHTPWKPWLMALLASTNTREGAYMMEASIIFHLERDGINIDNNLNWTVSGDYGGEGPIQEDDAHKEHFVYVALKPLPPRTAEERQAAASARSVASGEAAVLAQLEASNPLAGLQECLDAMETKTTDDVSAEVDRAMEVDN